MSLLRDTRGAQLVEYLGLVGLIALATLVSIRIFGDSVGSLLRAEAACVRTLDGAGCAGDPEGPPPPPPPEGASGLDPGASGLGPAAPPPGLAPGSSNGDEIGPVASNESGGDDVDADRLERARQLVSPAGSADANDADVVARVLAKLPDGVLAYMQKKGIRVVAVRNSVTDYLTDLKGKRPRGWPPGATWDSVPGTVWNGKQVVIAVQDGKLPPAGAGHGAHSLVFHETFHAIDYAGGRLSNDKKFRRARDAAEASLPAYLRQSGSAGREETFAESAAQYYGADPDLDPALREFWENNDERLFPPPKH